MKTFILLHGSYHGAWNWHKLVPHIHNSGHRAINIDMPAHGIDRNKIHSVTLDDYVNKTIQTIQGIEGKVILLAHSRNGIVISKVAEKYPEKIEKLIYLAAYLIPNGKSMMDYALLDRNSLVIQNTIPKVSIKLATSLLKNYTGYKKTLIDIFLPKTFRTHRLSPHIFREALYHDCPAEITELANVLLTPEPNLGGFEKLKLTKERYGIVPKIYIECLQDRAVTLFIQRKMQKDSPCDHVFQIDSSHSPFFSKPEELCRILNEIALK
ncbi:alpha/beta fold hydrolase [Leptospira perdikensis]|uniref:Alpha/beta fold hydrolase n=1 Tax=Leptospira perdikensis TaxID=2484948 RepID=A0A4R9JN27_9LEPT|nr:alpha/beta fold hydrolase [Leptospira perdikensis]TGL45603.1 alpha/beta fold hydrolase [Leptospira perdikensis]